MLGIRYTPLPSLVKARAIWLAQPKVVAVCVAVIQDAEGQVLMLRTRYSARWLLPGGVVEVGEDPYTGVLRECHEELGQAVTVERLTGIYADAERQHILFGFRCAPLTAPITLSEEHDAYRYGNPTHALAPLGVIARDAVANLPTVQMRRISGMAEGVTSSSSVAG